MNVALEEDGHGFLPTNLEVQIDHSVRYVSSDNNYRKKWPLSRYAG